MSQSQLGLTEYYNAYLQPGKECSGGQFRSSAQLQRLRRCKIVNESIVLDGLREVIDPTVFWDIEQIQGLLSLYELLVMLSPFSGGISVVETLYMTSIDGFTNLASIGNLGSNVGGVSYSVVVTGDADDCRPFVALMFTHRKSGSCLDGQCAGRLQSSTKRTE